MTGKNSPSKLVLPTVETCRWRYEIDHADQYDCGLIADLISIPCGKSIQTRVSADACEACCRSFPPSRTRLNPIVAGVLYSAAESIIASGGTSECTTEQAEIVRQRAEDSLLLMHEVGERLIPARQSAVCCFRGQLRTPRCVSPESEQRTSEGVVEESYQCLHPAHSVTTPEKCQGCHDWCVQKPVSRLLSLEELIPLPARHCGVPVRQWAVGVTTAPRRESTLEACLDSIQRAGWRQPRLFLDGTVRLPERYNHLPLTWREHPVGAMAAWLLALTELVHQQPEADAYLLLQDDVILYDREPLREYLERALWPGDQPGVVSLFYTGLSLRFGWMQKSADWHWGAQAFVFPPDIARTLICDPEIAEISLAASATGHIPIPETIRDWVQRSGTAVWHTTPSLSQHIGNSSTLWNDAALVDGRRAHLFCGSMETPFAAGESLADFPEGRFPCSGDRSQYEYQVALGYRRMQGLRVALYGLCRDVRPFLPRTAARVERLGQLFNDYRVVLYENDSSDATLEFLNDWQSGNERVTLISERHGQMAFPQVRSTVRAAWLAQCRNRCRETVIRQFSDFDFVIAFDADLVGGWSYDGIAHTFGGDEFDFVGSYGIAQRTRRDPPGVLTEHVDIWAFRPACGTPTADDLVNHASLKLGRGEPLMPVDSCFGGLGIYTMECLKLAEYGGDDCEHVVLHQRLRLAGFRRLYLNPSQIVLYTP